jgi:uncharacterized protein YutE (UPF0331/DUF86 family)
MSPGTRDDTLVRRHLLALDRALSRLEPRAQLALTAYLADPELQWAVERGLLVCAQNVLDIAAHLGAAAGLDSADYASSIDGLADIGVVPRDFAAALRPLAGFRNVLVHAYLTLEPARVHEALSSKLPELRTFAKYVEDYLAEPRGR